MARFGDVGATLIGPKAAAKSVTSIAAKPLQSNPFRPTLIQRAGLNVNPTSTAPKTNTFGTSVTANKPAAGPSSSNSLVIPRHTAYRISNGAPYETDRDAKGVSRWYFNGQTYMTGAALSAAMDAYDKAHPKGGTLPGVLPPPQVNQTVTPNQPSIVPKPVGAGGNLSIVPASGGGSSGGGGSSAGADVSPTAPATATDTGSLFSNPWVLGGLALAGYLLLAKGRR